MVFNGDGSAGAGFLDTVSVGRRGDERAEAKVSVDFVKFSGSEATGCEIGGAGFRAGGGGDGDAGTWADASVDGSGAITGSGVETAGFAGGGGGAAACERLTGEILSGDQAGVVFTTSGFGAGGETLGTEIGIGFEIVKSEVGFRPNRFLSGFGLVFLSAESAVGVGDCLIVPPAPICFAGAGVRGLFGGALGARLGVDEASILDALWSVAVLWAGFVGKGMRCGVDFVVTSLEWRDCESSGTSSNPPAAHDRAAGRA